jgi:hypothetical protein
LARVSARVLGNTTGLALVCDSAMALGARWARESAESWVAVRAPALARESAEASAAAMRQGTRRLRGRLRRMQRAWF